MSDLNDFTDDELIKEIERRKEESSLTVPKFLPDAIIIESIMVGKIFMDENINYLLKNGEAKENFEHDCFEFMLESFYGESIFKWWNDNYK